MKVRISVRGCVCIWVCVGSSGDALDEELTVSLANVVCDRRDRSEVREAHVNIWRKNCWGEEITRAKALRLICLRKVGGPHGWHKVKHRDVM